SEGHVMKITGRGETVERRVVSECALRRVRRERLEARELVGRGERDPEVHTVAANAEGGCAAKLAEPSGVSEPLRKGPDGRQRLFAETGRGARGVRTLRAKARRSLTPRERSERDGSGGRSSQQASRPPVRPMGADPARSRSDGGGRCRDRTCDLLRV